MKSTSASPSYDHSQTPRPTNDPVTGPLVPHASVNIVKPSSAKQCSFCGESNHPSWKCRFQRKVQCHNCRKFGHKWRNCKLTPTWRNGPQSAHSKYANLQHSHNRPATSRDLHSQPAYPAATQAHQHNTDFTPRHLHAAGQPRIPYAGTQARLHPWTPLLPSETSSQPMRNVWQSAIHPLLLPNIRSMDTFPKLSR